MKTARDIMTTPAETLAPTATLTEAARQLRDLNVGSLPILDGDHLVGVVTDRDIVVRGIAERLDPSSATVAEVATGAVVTVDVDDDAESVARVMGERQVRRVPVLDGGRLVGVIAQADVARDLDARTTGDVVEDISERYRGWGPVIYHFGRQSMGFGDKIQETIGKAKEGLGDLIDNDELRREGQKDRIEASAKQVGDEVNERFTDATGNVADKVEDFKRDVADGR